MSPKTEKMKLSENGVILEEALLAYANNELTAEQKQEMDKLLLDDPFAQDALEGLQQSNKAKAASVVLSINKKVREKAGIREAKTLKIHWSAYAWAAVVFGLLIGVGFVMVNYMGKQQNSIAMNEKAKDEGVNLLEQKQETVTPSVSAVPFTNSDTTAGTYTGTAQDDNSSADADALYKKDGGAETKNTNGLAATSAQPVTTTSGTLSPSPVYMNSTILADDKGTAPAKPVAKTNTGLKIYADSASSISYNWTDSKAAESRKRAAKEPKVLARDENPSGYTIGTQDNVYNSNPQGTSYTITQRGAIEEKTEADKVRIITMDDAMKTFNSGDYKTSSEQFSEILKQQPGNADALYFGGISDYINGNTKRSEKNFDKLLKDGTKFTEGSKWYKANILLKKGKRDEAKKILDELANSGGSYRERAIKKKAEMEF